MRAAFSFEFKATALFMQWLPIRAAASSPAASSADVPINRRQRSPLASKPAAADTAARLLVGSGAVVVGFP